MPEIVGTLKSPRLATAPSAPVIGQIYYNTGDNKLYWWNSIRWVLSTDVFNVKDFGAKGDNSTDDTAAFRLAYAAASAAGGGVVAIPSGIFCMNFAGTGFSLTLPSKVRLVGSGMESTILKVTGTASGTTNNAVVLIDTVFDVGIEDLTIDLNSIAGVGGIRGAATTSVRIKNVRIKNEGVTSACSELLLSTSTDVLIDNCRFEGIYQAICCSTCINTIFTNNKITAGSAITGQMVLFGSSTNNVVNDNIVIGNSNTGTTGIASDGQGTINGNLVRNVGMGIHIEYPAAGFSISGNICMGITNADNYGILVLGATTAVSVVTIIGNTIDGFKNGIHLFGAVLCNVSGNVINGSAQEAIYLEDDSSSHHSNNNRISENVIGGCSGAASGTYAAIRLVASQVCQIIGNRIVSASGFQPKYGIQTDSSCIAIQIAWNMIYGVATSRYSLGGGTLESVSEIDSETTMGLIHSRQIYPGSGVTAGATQVASGLLAGTGSPNNGVGNNGDFYFRSDGGVGTRIYVRTGGAWTGIV